MCSRKVRLVLATAILASGAVAGAPGRRRAPEACLSTDPPTPMTPQPCVLHATLKDGIDAVGDWTVRITRVVKKRPRPIVIDSHRLPAKCVRTGLIGAGP